MNYFITSRQDIQTSAIELAQVKRLKIFDYLQVPATIITMQYNFDHHLAETRLNTSGRVINLFQYYQQLVYQLDPTVDQRLIHRLLDVPGSQIKDHSAMIKGKPRVRVTMRNQRLYYVDYLDRYGFIDRRDFYDLGCRTYTEYFEDKGRIVTRQYYDQQGQVKLSYHYRGGEGNVPVLTLIQLNTANREWQFNNEDELRAHFLDELVQNHPQTILISDRSNIALTPFQLMANPARRYQVFHSAFTDNGQRDGQVSAIYQPLTKMLASGQLNGIIAATQREADDAANRFQTKHSFAIPVTYLTKQELTKHLSTRNRQFGNFIAVARLAKIKQLDHLIKAIIRLHQKYPMVELNIYGFADSWNHNQTANALQKLVTDQQATTYIHFCGYQTDLTAAYEQAYAEVLTSYYEGFAMAVLEAQGYGCPVISYDINYGPAEIIDNQVSGELVPANDQEALYQALARLLANPQLATRYGQHAQAAASKYEFTRVAKCWERLINNSI